MYDYENDYSVDVVEEEIKETIEDLYGEVNFSKVNVRLEPNKDSKVVTVLNGGTIVNILDESEDGKWYKILTNGVEGYCMQDLIDLS